MYGRATWCSNRPCLYGSNAGARCGVGQCVPARLHCRRLYMRMPGCNHSHHLRQSLYSYVVFWAPASSRRGTCMGTQGIQLQGTAKDERGIAARMSVAQALIAGSLSQSAELCKAL